MTPAVNTLKKKKISYTLHHYTHDPGQQAYGEEAVEKLSLPADRVYKTLVCQIEPKELVVAVIPVNEQLNMKLLAKACGSKKAVMADKNEVQKVTGYVLGGVSPVGQKKRLQLYLAETALGQDTLFVSGGKRGLEIELSPQDLLKITGGATATLF